MAAPGEGFYPYQSPIDAYGNGGFRFAGMSHRGSLLCLPTGMHACRWLRRRRLDISLSLAPRRPTASTMCARRPRADIVRLDPAIREAMRERRIIVEAVSTGSAVRTYISSSPSSGRSPPR